MEQQRGLFAEYQKGEISLTEIKPKPKPKLERLTFIDIFRADLHDYIFEEDDFGRYRERIIEKIKGYGVKNWFIKMGLPIEDDSVWVNRHNGKSKTTLKEEVNQYPNFAGIEQQGYYLWENWIPEKKEEIKTEINKDLCACGKPKVWDTMIRTLCDECLKKHYQELFKKNGGNQDGLNEFGYQTFQDKTGYHFYSHTTGYAFVFKDKIMEVFDSIMPTKLFPYCVMTCDEKGKFKNTLGITKEFGEKIIADLGLVLDETDVNKIKRWKPIKQETL